MSKYHLGEFEEIVMLAVAILPGKAYRVAIIEEMEGRLNRKVGIGSLLTVLRRLEDKRYLSSEFGGSTQEKGGKRKRYFTVTNFGLQVLRETKEQRMGLWGAIPPMVWNPQFGQA